MSEDDVRKAYAGPLRRETSAKGSTIATIEELSSRLANKYGKPVTEEGECEPTAKLLLMARPLTCSRMWKSEGQNIKMFWSIFDGRFKDFILAYKPLPTEI